MVTHTRAGELNTGEEWTIALHQAADNALVLNGA